MRFCTAPKLLNRCIDPQLRFGSSAFDPLLHENGVIKSKAAVFPVLPSDFSLDGQATSAKLRFLPLLREIVTLEESSVDRQVTYANGARGPLSRQSGSQENIRSRA